MLGREQGDRDLRTACRLPRWGVIEVGKWIVTNADGEPIGSIENGEDGAINLDISGEVTRDGAEKVRDQLFAAINLTPKPQS